MYVVHAVSYMVLNFAEKICFISASDRPQQITAEWPDLNIMSSCMPYKPCRCSQQDWYPYSREAESIILTYMTYKAVHRISTCVVE